MTLRTPLFVRINSQCNIELIFGRTKKNLWVYMVAWSECLVTFQEKVEPIEKVIKFEWNVNIFFWV